MNEHEEKIQDELLNHEEPSYNEKEPTYIFVKGGLVQDVINPPECHFIIDLDMEGCENCPLCYGKLKFVPTGKLFERLINKIKGHVGKTDLICPYCGINWDSDPGYKEIMNTAEEYYKVEIESGFAR